MKVASCSRAHGGVVEAQHVERLAVHDQDLAVIADEVVARACHGHALVQHALFELAKPLVRPLVGVRNEGTYVHSSPHGCLNRFLDLLEVEPENDGAVPLQIEQICGRVTEVCPPPSSRAVS